MILSPTLSLSAGSGAAIARPTFSRDFAGEKTLNNGTGPAITFTRASIGTFFDANGTLQTASNDTPRFDHDPADGASRGLLIEESRINSIRNSQAGGASAGVMPTNWTLTANANGVTSEVIGVGTENGLAFVDIKVSGTPTANGGVYPTPESANHIAATSGQTWTFSGHYKLVGGSLSNAVTRIYSSERGSGGASLAGTSQAITPTSASLASQRASVTRVFNNGSTNFALGFYEIAYTNGNAIDITLRIAAPQLEQGAFPTSYIPTTAAAVTRSADSAVVTPISSFYNASEGTLFAEYSGAQVGASSRIIARFNDNTTSNQIGLNATSPNKVPAGSAVSAGSSVFSSTIGSAPSDSEMLKFISVFKTDDFIAARGGTLGSADTSGAMPSGLTHFYLGQAISAHINGHIRKIAYWPRRLSNALLQSLTT
jgi:hypothetical protein